MIRGGHPNGPHVSEGHRMRDVLTGFKTFLMRGNVLDLAVAVVIGTAFTAVVKALVTFIITPVVGMIFGKASLAKVWDIGPYNNATISVGGFLDAVLQFLFVATAVYFFIVLPVKAINERRAKGIEPVDPLPEPPTQDILLLTEIRDLLAQRNAGGTGGATGHAGPTIP